MASKTCGEPQGEPAARQRYSQRYVVATGKLRSCDLSEAVGTATYGILTVERGADVPEIVTLLFFPNSVPRAGLPRDAILILEQEQEDGCIKDIFSPIGWDAYRGILPDTERTRARIARVPNGRLYESPPDKRISEEAARRLALQAVQPLPEGGWWKDAVAEVATRYNFGWIVFVRFVTEDGQGVFGDTVPVTVGDDGIVKDVGCAS